MIKNVAKNYGLAVCNFILDDNTLEILKDRCTIFGVSLQEFRNWILSEKKSLRGIEKFKNMLIESDEDS